MIRSLEEYALAAQTERPAPVPAMPTDMSELRRPWIAYKVLAAGAIQPRAGLGHAFNNGADFAAVGMFDFQIAENVSLTAEAVTAALNREREWLA